MFQSERIEVIPLRIEGVFGLATNQKQDERGTLTRLWEENLTQSKFSIKQISIVTNPKPLTLRGLHFQTSPYSENKIIYCISGKIFEVVLDLRIHSKTYGEHLTVETGLTSDLQGLVVPIDCAHGYLTLAPNSSLIYFIDNFYSAESARGVLWNDPNLEINWPANPSVISKRDSSWPQLKNL